MSSAPKTISPEREKAGTAGSGLARANPVALEVPVSVTGARANSSGPRELFTEETQTVLLFRDGAVIRLTGAVSVGQLLFLSNKKNNREVVCQVLHMRDAGPTSAHVELQFTDGKADFWDVPFDSSGQSATEFSRPEQVEAEQTTVADLGTAVAPHKPEDVDHLKKEVEALRKQLFDLANKDAPAPKASGAGGEQRNETPLMPAAAQSNEPARAVVGMALPMGKPASAGEKDPSEELLPQPELDFSHMPKGVVSNVRSAYRARHVHLSKVMVPGLCVLALVLAVVVWMGKPWRYFGGIKVPVVKTGQPVAAANKPGTATSAAGNAGKVAGKPEAMKTGAPTTAAEKNVSATVPETKEPGAKVIAEREPAADMAAKPVSTEGTSAKKRVTASAGKNGTGGNAPAEKNAGGLALNDAPILPAKLLKAANPVYPPDAMRSFITGDVRTEAVVEADGHVGEVKVLSGPKPLRDAAVEALKQYQYAPATQGGKGVASKVTVTVKFWFNP